MTYFTDEHPEGVTAQDVSIHPEARPTKRELVLKRRGSIVGKWLRATRSRNSMDHDKDGKRDYSEKVLRHLLELCVQNEHWDWSDSYPHTCLHLRRMRVSPWRIFIWRLAEMQTRTSLARSLVPYQ